MSEDVLLKSKHLRLSTLNDPSILGPRLRQEDKDEIYAGSGLDPVSSLMHGVLYSKPCYTALTSEGVPIGMFGIIPETAMSAQIWAVFTPEILQNRKDFMRVSRMVVEEFNNRFPMLFSFVDARNDVHIRWLKYLDCSFIHKEDRGHLGKAFYEFVRLKGV